MKIPVKIGIKAKILISTSMVVIVSLVISCSVAYLYFLNILKEQVIKDDGMRLNLTKGHLEYVIDDIKNYSNNIALSTNVQDFFKVNSWKGNMDELRYKYTIRSILMNFKSLREYVQSLAIIRQDGVVCTNDEPFDNYIRDSLSEEWFLKYKKEPSQFYFSDPRIQSDRYSKFEVITYITEVRDIDNPMQFIGYIVVNLYKDHFEKMIKPESEGFESYILYESNYKAIFEKNTGNYSINPAFLSQQKAADSSYGSHIYRESNGYVILSAPMSNGWQLASFTSNSTSFKKINYILYIFIFLIAGSLILIILTIMPIVLGITKPVTNLTKAMNKVSGGNMDINLKIDSGDELQILGDGFNRMIQELKSYIEKSIEYEKTKRNMEFSLLLSQINPHFIYNTLNTVIYLAKKNQTEDIANMMDSFIRILQDAVKINDQGVFATVRQEVDVAKHYVNIQQYRYPERFNVIWNLSVDVMDAWVPKTILQPLIENALIHGVFPSDKQGKIEVIVTKQDNDLVIEVWDNGTGMDEDTVKLLQNAGEGAVDKSVMRSIGIPNIINRISYLYGENYGMNISSSINEWTRIVVRIPYSNAVKAS